MKGKIRLWSYALIVALTFVLGSNSIAAQAEVDAKAKKDKKSYKDDKTDAKADKAGKHQKADHGAPGHSKKIDLNTASRDELLTLKGVGPATADAIIAARPFSKVEELKEVPGIGDVRWGEIRRDVTVKEPRTKANKESKERKEPRTTKTAPSPTERAPAGAPATTEQAGRSERPRLEQPKGRPAPPSDNDLSEIRTININTASREEIEELLGIGPVKAQAIIDNRPYRSIEEVKEVKGIKDKTFDKIRDRITVR